MDQSQDNSSPPSSATRPKNSFTVGVHGVRLKHFEEVVAQVLPKVQPTYVCLPAQPPSNLPANPLCQADEINTDESDWPFSKLPVSARVFGTNPGQLPKAERAARKEGQLRSMLRCIFRLIPSDDDFQLKDDNPFTIVDFGGGSGHLGIPLALLLPHCRVIVVDLRKHSLDLMHKKASHVVKEICKNGDGSTLSPTPTVCSLPEFVKKHSEFRRCGSAGVLENLYSFHGPVEAYSESFDMALALHLCGEATDVTLRKAAAVEATAMIVAPCCVGKLSQKVRNPDVYHATGQNVATVSYPQSDLFCQLIPNRDDWDALVKAADYSNEQESRTSRNATRRTAKALLETDRRLFLEQECQYQTALMRMDPWEVTPKNDILVAWKPDKVSGNVHEIFAIPDLECHKDIDAATKHLLYPSDADSSSSMAFVESSDWTQEEERIIQEEIQTFLGQTEFHPESLDQVYVFPTRMGGRKRKLIHFVAGRFDLAHWSVGEKDGDKTVAIARRGQQHEHQVTLA